MGGGKPGAVSRKSGVEAWRWSLGVAVGAEMRCGLTESTLEENEIWSADGSLMSDLNRKQYGIDVENMLVQRNMKYKSFASFF